MNTQNLTESDVKLINKLIEEKSNKELLTWFIKLLDLKIEDSEKKQYKQINISIALIIIKKVLNWDEDFIRYIYVLWNVVDANWHISIGSLRQNHKTTENIRNTIDSLKNEINKIIEEQEESKSEKGEKSNLTTTFLMDLISKIKKANNHNILTMESLIEKINKTNR